LLALAVSPNPVQEAARLELSLPSAERVRVSLFDVSGRSMATLVDETFPAGHHTIPWEVGLRDGRSLAPGVYWVRLVAGDRSVIRRITVVR
jgi:hypothetical protein